MYKIGVLPAVISSTSMIPNVRLLPEILSAGTSASQDIGRPAGRQFPGGIMSASL